ncbi:uncharacterized protein GGS22DRAFT_69297 [Annulohypoxylon maeteangense]|uniref:uncharacterized protein n=1 Tax=Annulohypoxylon maeteangense TaxID=1927788 RepID=UPI002008C3E5|nr:uncharacterized protein GGS22DRAFT_69297 [Annulohypoxylon maeteangense]KAI0889263.1 hypothetical protein GGS22DRAFT_69297 [Annulohypoxylon maeteangense]
MRHQITILAIASLAPNALAQSSSSSMDMSMPMDMSMSMTMPMPMPMPSSTATSTPNPTRTISIPCLVPGALVLVQDLPKPSNTALISYLSAATPNINTGALASSPCAVASSLVSALPSSLRTAAASYQTQLASFVAANAKNISSVYAECNPLPSATTISGFGFSPANITDAVNLVTAFADTGCVKVAQATGTGKGSSGSGNGAVARQTGGVAAAAVVVVGVVGAVAML